MHVGAAGLGAVLCEFAGLVRVEAVIAVLAGGEVFALNKLNLRKEPAKRVVYFLLFFTFEEHGRFE